MTATDELRRMLDEHGIEYCGGEIMTYTEDAEYMPSENNTFDVTLYHLTPAQAVEATLGNDGAGRTDDGVAERGTCSRESRRPMAKYVYGTDGREGHWLTGEEIVRCRDCAKWSFFDTEDGKRIGDCSEWTHLDGFSHATNENGFCAWGERK